MITQKLFGNMPDGTPITLYSISNKNGVQADVMNYGAILVNLFVPNKKGKLADINLGYDKLEKYFTVQFKLCISCTVGNGTYGCTKEIAVGKIFFQLVVT